MQLSLCEPSDAKCKPTIGYLTQYIKYKGCNFEIWDVGASDKIRFLFKHYYSEMDAFIYVVDSNDRERFEESAGFLKEIINAEETQKKPILIMANKQDLETALAPEEIAQKLGNEQFKGRDWNIIDTSKKGKGIIESLDWLFLVLTGDKDELKNKEIKELKEELSKSKKIIEELKNRINILENKLKSENEINYKKILNLQNVISEKVEEMNKSKENELKNNQLNLSVIQNLQNIINEKDEELNKLKEKLKNNKCVIFISNEEDLCFAIPCSGDSFFSEVEELLYKEYPEFRGTYNKFLLNGKEIIRNKTINANKIGNGKPIVLIKTLL